MKPTRNSLVAVSVSLLLGTLLVACADTGGGASNDALGGDGNTSNICGGIACGIACCDNVCTDTSSNPDHCGGCDVQCTNAQGCYGGLCLAGCGDGRFTCGTQCVDLNSNSAHCGVCGFACGAGEVCSMGVCATGCSGGLSACDGGCVNLANSAEHCGACAAACGDGQLCQASACTCAAGFADCDGVAANGCEAQGGCTCTPNETRGCYTGFGTTRSTGACKDGTQTCASDGSSWSACDGQVLPQKEVCGNSVDDDCDGATDENLDEDGDGYGACDGDCCDSAGQGCALDPSKVNPRAMEFAGNFIDDDCDGTVDNVTTTTCGTQPVLSNVTGEDLARAMGLCKFTTASSGEWGVLEASLHRSDGSGSPDGLQLAALTSLGGRVAAVDGATMASLSSGTARGPGDSGYVDPSDPSYESFDSVTAPSRYLAQHGGQLQTVAGCPAGGSDVNDSAMVRLRIRVPSNAEGFSFNHRFFSAEYPVYLCTAFNDFFLALLDSQHVDIPADGNISFDANGDPVSVNNAFFTTCEAQSCGYSFFGDDADWDGCPDSLSCNGGDCGSASGACPDGATDVQAYTSASDASGATSWLTTTAPIVPGEEITLEFHIWDTSDTLLDSLVLIDNFQWRLEPTELATFN